MKCYAYHYSFDLTGNKDIDRILKAVAAAGKAYHDTSAWTETWDWCDDPRSEEQKIQDAANEAAKNIGAQV